MRRLDVDKAVARIEADPELLAEFIGESKELLENADQEMLRLEQEPTNQDAIDTIFRAFHTIKGVSGFLGLDSVRYLAHQTENLLHAARDGVTPPTPPQVDALFGSVDTLRKMVDNVEQTPLDVLTRYELMVPAVARVHSVAAEGTPREEPDLPFLDGDAPESAEPLTPSEPVGQDPVGQDPVARNSEVAVLASPPQSPPPAEEQGEVAIFKRPPSSPPPVEEQGEVAIFKRPPSSPPPAEEQGEVAIFKRPPSSPPAAEEQGEVAIFKRPPPRPVAPPAAPPAEVQGEVAIFKRPPPRPGAPPLAEATPAAPAAPAAPKQAPTPASDGAKKAAGGTKVEVVETLKVRSDRLDQLVEMVGELVVVASMLERALALANDGPTVTNLRRLTKITRRLQELGTSLRMVPIGATFRRMSRVVRDLSRKTGKPVNFTVSGDETELDKRVVNLIGDPLLHMVRNAVDHGIEDTPALRRAAGKPDVASVSLSAYHQGGRIYIDITDDGKGLDTQRILAKAVERGVVAEDDQLQERAILQLLFRPGFSTKAQVTDLSGRGVGLDVVKRTVEALRGTIEVQSTLGVGSTFSIQLPLTLAIIDGMAVRVGQETYILPTLGVIRLIRATPKQLHTVTGSSEVLHEADELLPIVRLSDVLMVDGAIETASEAIMVLVQSAEKRAALMVDDVLGQQQVVIKNISEGVGKAQGIAGSAILPDGQVGLILDMGELIRLAQQGGGGPPSLRTSIDEQGEP